MKRLTFIIFTLLLFVIQANAQMVREWQSPAGTQTVNSVYIQEIPSGVRMDFDGDGFKDIPIFNRLGGHEPFFKVISGKNQNTTWQFPLTNINFVPGKTQLLGFFDVDKGNQTEKEAIVADRVQAANGEKVFFGKVAVISQSGQVIQYRETDYLFGIGDYDGDGDLEMLMGDSSVHVLELWGKGN